MPKRQYIAPVVESTAAMVINDTTATLKSGEYWVGALTGPLTISAHTIEDGETVRIIDSSSIAKTYPITLDFTDATGLIKDVIMFTDGDDAAVDAMELVIDGVSSDITLRRDGDKWHLDRDSGGSGGSLDIPEVDENNVLLATTGTLQIVKTATGSALQVIDSAGEIVT